MVQKLFILFYILLLRNVIATIGRSCQPNENISDGTCTQVMDCEPALRYIQQTRRHPFNRCGFDGEYEIVCCPVTTNMYGSTDPERDLPLPRTSDSPINNKFSGGGPRIAERECQKIIEKSIPPLGLYIIEGEVANAGEFPHMAALGYRQSNTDEYQFNCGGSLVSYDFVLTAAHCVDTLEKVVPSIARVGTTEIGTSQFNQETDINIVQIIKHPSYARKAKYHDLALLRLERSIEVSMNLNAICLYTSETDPSIPLTVTGWGTTSTTRNIKSTILLKANLTVVPRNICKKSYKNWLKLPRDITDEQICASDPKGMSDACQGDSGGPLQGLTSSDSYYRLVGVTAFGRGCGSQEPGVYTRIVKYLDWIESVLWP